MGRGRCRRGRDPRPPERRRHRRLLPPLPGRTVKREGRTRYNEGVTSRASLSALAAVAALGAGLALRGPAPFEPRSLQGASTGLSRTGEWTVDPMHSNVGFEIEHVGISKVRGRFDKFSGEIADDDKDLSRAKVSFTADVSSIDTMVPPRDEHLKSPDFFDVARYPELKFESARIERRARGYAAVGNLTMHGITRPVTIPFRMTGPVKDNFGAVRRGILADPFTIDRRDFGVSWQQTLPNGGKALGDTVTIVISLEAVPKAPAKG